MRMSTDAERDERQSNATIHEALDAGITVFDTARAYAPDPGQLGHNERLLARAIGSAPQRVRIITKGGMTRAGGGWVPDGRAKSIVADCEASLEALDGLGINLYLLHAPDPRTPWRTTVRALARLAHEGLVKRVGVSNVSLPQLEEACDLAPISAIQVALSLQDDRAIRGGLLDRCAEMGITLIAHSPLGGPRRAGGLAKRDGVAAVAERHGATPAEVALAWLLGLSENVVAIPGVRRPETARSAARAATMTLEGGDLKRLSPAASRSAPKTARSDTTADLVLMMGIPGAGKSRIAAEYVGRGYTRLSRDERGGTLRGIAQALDEQLSAGDRNVILDNTYLTRALRSHVIETAARYGLETRCVWLDTPLDQAQINLVERILDRFGELPSPEDLRAVAKREPGLMLPTSQMRALRELEPPTPDEGFTTIERVPFARARTTHTGAAGVLVAARALTQSDFESPEPTVPHLIFDWRPDGTAEDLADAATQLGAAISGTVGTAVCPHGGGPPSCWCRPPLPGLALAFARAQGLDPARVTIVGASPAHRTLARALGARYVST
jgi:aryl-alcohol dehydrogenase-like predicted oxidoreductase/predicted kinase